MAERPESRRAVRYDGSMHTYLLRATMAHQSQSITSLCLASAHEKRHLPGNFRARSRFASPWFRARQPFMLWWPSAAVTIRPTTSSRKAPVAILLKPLESQVTPELLSPIYSRLVPARSGCVRCSPVSERQRHHSLEGSINLVARRSARPHQRSRLNRTLREPAAL